MQNPNYCLQLLELRRICQLFVKFTKRVIKTLNEKTKFSPNRSAKKGIKCFPNGVSPRFAVQCFRSKREQIMIFLLSIEILIRAPCFVMTIFFSKTDTYPIPLGYFAKVFLWSLLKSFFFECQRC